MASVNGPPDVSLREATQRKLQRFSEMRGTPVLPGIRKGGGGSLRAGKFAGLSLLAGFLSPVGQDAGPGIAHAP